ncbi:MAG: hypothetical protein AAF500_15015 [Myxococcota bacterium]
MLPARAFPVTLVALSLTAAQVHADVEATGGGDSVRLHPVSAADLYDPSDPNQRFRPATTNAKTPAYRAARDPHWTQFRIDALQNEKRRLHVGLSAFLVSSSLLGFAAGTWLLAWGVEVETGPRETCAVESTDPYSCFGRPAPYAGTVVMGLSVFGFVRAAKRLKQRVQRKREIRAEIRDLSTD